VLQDPSDAEEFGATIAKEFRDANISTVVSPAIGGIIIGYETARALGAKFIWTERQNNEMVLRRGFSVSPGEKLLVVEDVITTGGSTRETVEALRQAGGEIVGAASIIDRSGGDADVGVRRVALATLSVPAVSPENCESCKQGDTVIKPGSRKDSPNSNVQSPKSA